MSAVEELVIRELADADEPLSTSTLAMCIFESERSTRGAVRRLREQGIVVTDRAADDARVPVHRLRGDL